MTRIEVVAERKVVNKNNDYEAMGMPDPDPEFTWRRRSVPASEIYAYEELSTKYTLLEMSDGEKFRIKENYEDFDSRLFTVENDVEIEFDMEEEGETEEETKETETSGEEGTA